MRGTTVVLLVSLVAACNKKSGEETAKHAPPPTVKVDLVAVSEAPTPETLTLTGMIAADQRAEVTADTQGKVLAVMIERGQRVKMGDPVVRLDVRSAALGAREAQANLSAARAQKALAEEECKRTKQLLDKGAITRSEYDRQSTQCTSALEQVSAAQARAEMMSKSVADGMVRAPFSGIVTQRMVTPGEWVAPGRPLFTLVDDEPLKIELSVPEKAVVAIAPDQPVVLMATALPCLEFAAKVTRIGGEIGRTRSLIVEATIDKAVPPRESESPQCKELDARIGEVDAKLVAKDLKPEAKPDLERLLGELKGQRERQKAIQSKAELVPGMFAEARVTIGEKRRPVVPATAVVQRGKTWHAFVQKGNELRDQIVLTGPSGQPGTVAILRGELKPGDKVAATVAPDVVDGVRIEGAAAPSPTAKPTTPTSNQK